jgi:WD40 repeat protein
VDALAVSPDGSLALSSSADGGARLWEVASGRALRQFAGQTQLDLHAVFAPDGRSALATSDGNLVRIFEIPSGLEVRQLRGHTGKVDSLAVSPDGKLLVSGSWPERTLRIWNLANGDPLGVYPLPPSNPQRSNPQIGAFLPDGAHVVWPCEDGTIYLLELNFDREDPRPIYENRVQPLAKEDHINRVVFAPDGKSYATGGADVGNTIRIYETATGRLISDEIKQEAGVQSLNFSADGRRLLSSGKRMHLWDLATKQDIGRFEDQNEQGLGQATLSPDGRLVLSRHSDRGVLQLWDVATGKKLRGLGESFGYCFTPDSRGVLIHAPAANGHLVQLVEPGTGAVVWSVAVNEKHLVLNGCWCLPGTSQLVAAFDDGTVIWRDLADGQEVRRLTLQSTSRILSNCSALAPDGQRLLTGHDPRYVWLWDLADGSQLRPFLLDRAPTGPPAFSPDGRYAVAHSFGAVANAVVNRSRAVANRSGGSQYFWKLPEPDSPADSPSRQGR